MKKGIILNGTSSIAVGKEDDVVYRLNPTPMLTPIYMSGLFSKKWQIFDLSQQIDTSYRVVHFIGNDEGDDDRNLEETVNGISINNLRLLVVIIEHGKIVSNSYLDHLNSREKNPPIYLLPHQKMGIWCDQELTSLTFYCEKIICENTINLLPEVSQNGGLPNFTLPSPSFDDSSFGGEAGGGA